MDKRWGVAAAAALAAGLFVAGDGGRWLALLDLASLRERQAELQAWRDARPLAAAALFFVAYVAAAVLSLPGAAVLTLAAGAIFGLGWGTLIVSFASSIGATGAFLSSRWLLGGWVRSRWGARLQRLDAAVARDGAWALFALRLVPVAPFFLVNLAMGLTPLRTWTFYWVSQAGMLAGTLVYVNAGTQLARIDSVAGVASPALLASLALLGAFPLLARRALAALRGRAARPKFQRPRRFDRNLVVIGGGSAGLVAAYIAAALKARVTLVEAHALGGDCLNTGCVPSKALLRSARWAAQARRAAEFGMRPVDVQVDFAQVMDRVQRVVQAIAPHDSVERYTALGVDVVLGRARIVSPWAVEVTPADGPPRVLTTRAIVVAAGAQPVLPPLPGLQALGAHELLTSDTVWALRRLPGRLVVLGGGPIGCELAQAFARLGAQVTQVEAGPRLLPREDEDVSALVAARFAAEGVRVLTGRRALRVEGAAGARALVLEDGDGDGDGGGLPRSLPFDALLVAVGRQARLGGYGLEALGLGSGRTLEVDGWLRTGVPGIFAAGDVAGPLQFTHAAAHQAWTAAVNALLHPLRAVRLDERVVPRATFVDPEVARVGLNEQEAREQGVPCEVTVYPLDDVDRAIADGEAHGFVKVLTKPGRDRILGVTIVGAHAAELLAEYALAMRHGLGLNQVLATVHTYPTMSEANKYAAGAWKRAHAPQALLRWAERFHAWRRG